MKRPVWLVIIVVVLLALAIAAAVTLPSVGASRLDAHSRSIDIDICIRCTRPGSPGPEGPPGEQGPPGPQGPPGDTRQTIVTLHDNAGGNAAGWIPGNSPGGDNFEIQAPIELGSEFSIEATFTNPSHNGFIYAESCHVNGGVDISTDTFPLSCGSDTHNVVEEGATLTYIITK